MSRRFRYRVAAVVLSGLLLGIPLLASGTASAGQVEAADRRAGAGGLLDPSCDAASLPPDPDCLFDDQATPSLIPATPAEPMLMPFPIPDPFRASPDARPGAGDPASLDATTDGVLSASPDASTSRPERPATHPATVVKPRPVQARPAKPRTRATADGRRPDRSGSARRHQTSTGAQARVQAGAASGADKKRPPRVPKQAVTPPATAPASAAGTVPSSPAAVAEPGVALGPLPPEQPIGLLALVASVCALGVGLGAIRAFVSQRAYRTRIA